VLRLLQQHDLLEEKAEQRLSLRVEQLVNIRQKVFLAVVAALRVL